MKKILFALLFLLPATALAQTGTISGDPHIVSALDGKSAKIANSTAPKPEEKAKPVIIPAAKMQELAALRKDLQLALLNIENAQLKIKELNAIIETAKGDGQKAKALEAEFWRKLGINPEELPTKWEPSDGQNGDIILKRKEEPAEKPKP